MLGKFIIFAPFEGIDNTYGGRTPKSIRTEFDTISTNYHKFNNALRRVVSFWSFKKNEEIVVSLNIILYTSKYSFEDYSFCG